MNNFFFKEGVEKENQNCKSSKSRGGALNFLSISSLSIQPIYKVDSQCFNHKFSFKKIIKRTLLKEVLASYFNSKYSLKKYIVRVFNIQNELYLDSHK